MNQIAPHLRADQVTYEQYDADRSKYTFPIAQGPMPQVASNKIHNVPVANPDGEMAIQVYQPSAEAIQGGGLKCVNGLLPAHVNYHGGKNPFYQLSRNRPT